MTKYQRTDTVDAIQYTGGEDSAAAVIEWAEQLDLDIDGTRPAVTRHWHHGSWNDKTPELWLQVVDHGVTLYVEPSAWLIDDGVEIDVRTHDDFQAAYRPVPA